MTRSTRRTSCGGSPSVIFNPRMTGHHLNTTQRSIYPPHSERMSAILAGAFCNLPCTQPEARKRAEKAEKAEEWQLKASPHAPPSRGLFPRHLRATFASFFVHLPILSQTAPPQSGKGINSFKKIVQICALLCICMVKKK